ncbi:hypothetical protein HMPREF0578_2081 [Mobiluncus mulieris 28-1]|nr:hypothetical protein HMPREF0578_2081 [Mobiluncus mulieris 28-1]
MKPQPTQPTSRLKRAQTLETAPKRETKHENPMETHQLPRP